MEPSIKGFIQFVGLKANPVATLLQQTLGLMKMTYQSSLYNDMLHEVDGFSTQTMSHAWRPAHMSKGSTSIQPQAA